MSHVVSLAARAVTTTSARVVAAARRVRLTAVAVVARNETKILRSDILPLLVVTVVIPIGASILLKPALGRNLRVEGHRFASGAEQVVPGMATVFSFFAIGHVASAFFREHGWHTWDRLRASGISRVEIVAGKAVPSIALVFVQFALVGVVGVAFLGLALPKPSVTLALAGVVAALGVCLAAIGVAVAAVTKTYRQANALNFLCVGVLGGLGGTLVPVAQLPGYLQPFVGLTPSYWSMRAFNSTLLGENGWDSCLLPIAVLTAMAALALATALPRFRAEERKQW
jgi:ABC-2 type transport system permease protein